MRISSSILIIASIGLFSCGQNPPTAGPSGFYTDLHLILNEGPFGSGTGTITAYNADTLIESAFASENGFPLGNVAQHMLESDSMLFVAINNSNNVYAVNRNTLQHKWTVGLEQPRYLAAYGSNIFVSNWKDSAVYVLSKETGAQVDSIYVGNFSEQMMVFDNKLFVGVGTYEGPYKIAEINVNTFEVTLHNTGDVPNSFAIIGNELYVMNSGEQNWGISPDTKSSIWKYTGSGFSEQAIAPNTNKHAISLVSDGTNGYFLNNSYDGAIVKWTPGQNWQTSAMTLPGGYKLNTHEGNLYFLDAKDYASNGELRVYSTSGDLLETVPAGVIPRQVIY